MKRLLQFLWKYRVRQFLVTLAFALAFPFYLAQGGDWPYLVLGGVLVYGAFIAVLVEGRIRMERQVAGHLLTIAGQLLHNTTHFVPLRPQSPSGPTRSAPTSRGTSPASGGGFQEMQEVVQDGAPTNEAWNRAMLKVKAEGHLHDDVNAYWIKSQKALVIQWKEL